MKVLKKIIMASMLLLSGVVFAGEKISIFLPHAASASIVPAMLRLADEANKIQSEYDFLVEFRPGANQTIALKTMDQNLNDSLALIAPAYVENHKTGTINKNNYVPLWGLGDACWALFTNVGDKSKGITSLAGIKELVIGGVGFGNAAHLTGIMLGEKFNFDTRYVIFKSNTDALINMVGNHGINMVLDKIEGYESFKPKNNNLQVLAVSCPSRMSAMLEIKTLREQGINAPSVFNIVVANKSMSDDKRNKLRTILTSAAEKLGPNAFMKLSGTIPPQFAGLSQDDYYNKSVAIFESLTTRYEKVIEKAKN